VSRETEPPPDELVLTPLAQAYERSIEMAVGQAIQAAHRAVIGRSEVDELAREELYALRLCTPLHVAALMRREGFDPETTALEVYARHRAATVLTIRNLEADQ
jgi:hypothetical protein